MPPSVFSHLGTVLASALLLAATSSSAGPIESAQPTIDDALLYEITTNARPVLLFTQLTSNHILVIIGSTERGINMTQTDMHVFEQPLSYLGYDCIHLKPSTPFLTRWPSVTGSYSARMFAVPDSIGDNIILRTSDPGCQYNFDVSVLHPNTGTFEALPKLRNHINIGVCNFTWILSSTDPMHYFWVNDYLQSTWLYGWNFNNATLDQATRIYQDNTIRYCICDDGPSSRGQRIRISPTGRDCRIIYWNITAGFMNATSVVLVDDTNSVLIFDRGAFTSGQPTDLVKIPAKKFWVKWVPPLEPENRTQMSSTETPAGTESTESTTAKWPVVLVLAIAVPNLLLIFCLVGLGIYCLCKSPKQSSDKSVISKPPKAVGGPRNQKDHKSAARTARKGTKEKHGSSVANLKTKAARSSTGAKKATASSSSHQPGKSAIASKVASKVGKTSKSLAVGKSAAAVSKASKNGKSSSKRSLAGRNTPFSKASRVH